MELVPLWLKLAYTTFAAILVPVYWVKSAPGPKNFLWFSDIALFGTVAALWLESTLLASMMAVAVMLPETLWILSYVSRLLTGIAPRGVVDYMFDASEAWYMHALSLFHVHMPIVLIWLVWRLGYDGRALMAQTVVGIVVASVTYVATEPRHNINRVFGPGPIPQRRVHPLVYLGLWMLIVPLGIYLPTHLLLQALFAR